MNCPPSAAPIASTPPKPPAPTSTAAPKSFNCQKHCLDHSGHTPQSYGPCFKIDKGMTGSDEQCKKARNEAFEPNVKTVGAPPAAKDVYVPPRPPVLATHTPVYVPPKPPMHTPPAATSTHHSPKPTGTTSTHPPHTPTKPTWQPPKPAGTASTHPPKPVGTTSKPPKPTQTTTWTPTKPPHKPTKPTYTVTQKPNPVRTNPYAPPGRPTAVQQKRWR